jgi:hypothetical protein
MILLLHAKKGVPSFIKLKKAPYWGSLFVKSGIMP